MGSVIMNKEFIISIAGIAAISMSGKFNPHGVSIPVKKKNLPLS